MKSFYGAVGFVALLAVGMILFLVVFLIHDASVKCHDRVRKDDVCWKDLNKRVDQLEIRVHQLESR